MKVYPGINISQMTGECSKEKFRSLITQKSVIIVHVGTNHVKKLNPGHVI